MSDNSIQAPSPEHLGELLPLYGIESFIALGGMGAVYKARQLSLDRDVAIKVLLYEFGEDVEFRESFTTEAKAMARLNHPNLLGVFDYGNVDGMPYIVMEYVDGDSLHQAAWNKVVDPSQAVLIVKGICDGLAHAHGHNIVHRDLKPSNILLTPNAEPKVADFGLAHATDSDQPGLVMGTPGYTAPEVFQNPNQAGKLADIYSVGVILHQLLTGIDPAGCLEPPSHVSGHPQLDAIWRKATHITPALRYPSVAAMATDLGKWASSTKPKEPLATKVLPNRPIAPRRPVKARPQGNAGGGVAKIFLLGFLAAVGFFTYQHLQKQQPEIKHSIAENSVSSTPIPAIQSVAHSPDPVEHSPPPHPDPTELSTRIEPVTHPVVDSHPDPDPQNFHDLPPGDPELLQRAIGLIQDSRKKRDAGFADNAKALLFQFASRAHTGKKEDAVFMESLKEMLAGNRVPVTEGAQQLPDDVVKNFEHARAKEQAIEDAHRSDLTRIRDAYVTRLKGAAADTADAGLKPRLLAQAERASDLDAWIGSLAPEPKRIPKRSTGAFGSGSIAGNWDNRSYNSESRWIAHPDGRMEIVGQTWVVTWKILADGTLQVDWGKKAPYTYTRDGDGWTGKNPHGGKATLTRGNW